MQYPVLCHLRFRSKNIIKNTPISEKASALLPPRPGSQAPRSPGTSLPCRAAGDHAGSVTGKRSSTGRDGGECKAAASLRCPSEGAVRGPWWCVWRTRHEERHARPGEVGTPQPGPAPRDSGSWPAYRAWAGAPTPRDDSAAQDKWWVCRATSRGHHLQVRQR